MGNLQSLKKEIAQTTEKSQNEEDPGHSESTLKWLLKLNPDATEEQQIAALAHDIERGVPPRTNQREGETYEEYKERHAKRSAEITAELMQKHGYSKESIQKVKQLIKKHEVGGTPETDEIRDADTLSYFDWNIDFYLKREGYEKTEEKIKFMYGRASERAKKEIRKLDFSPEVKEAFEAVVD